MAVAFRSKATAVSFTNAGNVVLSKPPSVVDGDLLLAHFSLNEVGQTISSVPSGWQLVPTASGNPRDATTDSRHYLYYKIAASEGASWTWTISGATADGGAQCYAFSGADPDNPIEAADTSLASATALTPATLTAAGADRYSFVCYAADCETTGDTDQFAVPAGYTEHEDVETASTVYLGACGKAIASSGSVAPGDVTASESDTWIIYHVLIQPPGTSPFFNPKTRSWRWYNDATPDGSLTAQAAENTGFTLSGAQMQDALLRLRVQIEEAGGAGGTTGGLHLQYSVDNATWVQVEKDAPVTTGNEGTWFRIANGAATGGNTIGSQLLTGTTASGKYHESRAVTETLAANEIREIDFALKVHWPPPDLTIYFRVVQGGEAGGGSAGSQPQAVIPNTGSITPRFTTSTAANRPYTVTKIDPDPGQKVSRDAVRFAPWERLYWAQNRWWYFYVQYGTPKDLKWRTWTGTGAWSSESSQSFTDDGVTSRHATAFADIGGTSIVHALFGNSSSTRRGRRGVLNSDGTVTWGTEWSVAQASENQTHVAIDDGGYVWIGGIGSDGASIWCRRSTNADAGSSWTSGFNVAKTVADTGLLSTATSSLFALIPLASDKVLALWYNYTDQDIKWATCTDASGFSSVGTVNTTTAAHDETWGARRQGGTVFLTHTDKATGAPEGATVLRVYDIAGNTWSTGTSPSMPDGTIPSNGDGLPIVFHPSSNKFWLFFTQDGAESGGQDRRVGFKAYTWTTGSPASGTWDGSITLATPTAARGNGDHVATARVAANGQVVVLYLHGDDSQGSTQNLSTGFVTEYHVVDYAVPLSGGTPFILNKAGGGSTLNGGNVLNGSASGATLSRAVPTTVAISTTESRVVPTSAALTTTETRSAPTTAAVQTTGARVVSSTAAIQTTETRSAPTTVAVQSTEVRVVPATVALQTTNVRSVPTSVAISTTEVRVVPATASISSADARSVPTSAAVQTTESRVVPTSASVQTTDVRAVPTSVSVQTSDARSVLASAAVSATETRVVPATAAISVTSARITTATASISTGLPVTALYSAGLYDTDTYGNRDTRAVPTTAAIVLTWTRTAAVTAAISVTAIYGSGIYGTDSYSNRGTRTVPFTAAISITDLQVFGGMVRAEATSPLAVVRAEMTSPLSALRGEQTLPLSVFARNESTQPVAVTRAETTTPLAVTRAEVSSPLGITRNEN